ncbi:MAG: hypothetical protein K5663_00920 [Clostridiales bacterium]|nr:hypothetical protein [Clostridiales bacterium]
MKPKEPRKAYVKQKLKSRNLAGSELILCGALVLLIWALGDFLTRFDAMDGLLKVELNRIRHGKSTLGETISEIWSEPEARRDLITLAMRAFACFVGIWGIITHKLRTGMVTLIGAVIVLVYDTNSSLILKLTNYNTYVKVLGCVLLTVGSLIKTIFVFVLKRKLFAKYDKKHIGKPPERIPLDSNGSVKTLIPVRQKEYSK